MKAAVGLAKFNFFFFFSYHDRKKNLASVTLNPMKKWFTGHKTMSLSIKSALKL